MKQLRVCLLDEVVRCRPDVVDPEAAIRGGRVVAEGRFLTNPAARVRRGAPIVVRPDRPPLRGAVKLAAALERFAVVVEGRVALDAGAAAGGFTTALLEAGAARVYAVDAGHGQLVGALRQDPRVINLEGVNLSALDGRSVPEPIAVVTLDLSYVSLADAVPQLDVLDLAPGAEMVALVKPMFELGLATAPEDRASLDGALRRAAAGIEAAGWPVLASMDSAVRGRRGAPELLIHARR